MARTVTDKPSILLVDPEKVCLENLLQNFAITCLPNETLFLFSSGGFPEEWDHFIGSTLALLVIVPFTPFARKGFNKLAEGDSCPNRNKAWPWGVPHINKPFRDICTSQNEQVKACIFFQVLRRFETKYPLSLRGHRKSLWRLASFFLAPATNPPFGGVFLPPRMSRRNFSSRPHRATI